MHANAVLTRSESASFEVVGGEAIVIHLDTGTYYSLDEIGTIFWEMLDGHKTLADIGAHIAERYEVEPEMVTGDLVELADDLVTERLVEPA